MTMTREQQPHTTAEAIARLKARGITPSSPNWKRAFADQLDKVRHERVTSLMKAKGISYASAHAMLLDDERNPPEKSDVPASSAPKPASASKPATPRTNCAKFKLPAGISINVVDAAISTLCSVRSTNIGPEAKAAYNTIMEVYRVSEGALWAFKKHGYIQFHGLVGAFTEPLRNREGFSATAIANLNAAGDKLRRQLAELLDSDDLS